MIEPCEESTLSIQGAAGATALGRRVRIAGARRKALLTFHIAAALGLFGASFVLFVAGLYAATRDDPGDAHAIYALLRLLTFTVDIPFAVLTLLAGLALALTSKWRVFRYWWVMGKLALHLANITIGIALIGPSIDTMLDVTKVESPANSGSRWTLVVMAGAQAAMLLAAASLAVFKPGGARARHSRGAREGAG